ncbi:MAG: VWA domain-containing protein [Planctomycetia bacterium]|nr:VWA domain-containing protein [Planctomycetia bacterium]
MFRSQGWVRRLIAVSVPALLLAVLVGCGVQQQPAPEVAQAQSEEVKKEDPPKQEPATEPEGEVHRLKNEIKRIEESIKEVKQSKGKQENLLDRADNLSISPSKPAPDSVILGGSGKGSVGGIYLPKPGDPKPVNGQGEAKPGPTGYNAQNAETYSVYRENEFRSPLVAPLSTFSADVNTASYANTRRFITEGKLPPASAVFLAEFVNYFPYSYAQPKGDDPVAFHIEMGPCPWNRKHHLLRVGVQAYQIPADKLPPRNLVFLIDTSGSMQQENRLPLVKKSLGLLVETLTEKDRVSIVTYAGDVNVSLVGAKGSEKQKIKNAVDELRAQGSTYGEGGIKRAYQLARETFIEGGVNRVILCTDGDFNVGVTDNGELVKLIEDQRRSRVFLTILGFAMGNYKDDRLKELANHGNGHHAYIDSLDEAKKVFVEQGGALVCVAKDVKFQIDFNPTKVNAYRLVGYENRLLKDEDFKNDAKDADDMGSGHQVTVLYEIVPSNVKFDLPEVEPSKYQKQAPANIADEWLEVRMRYKHPEAETSKELSKAFKGEVAKDLSDDFRFAAAAASFGMILRDSKFRGAMTYAGVIEEAQGCLGADPNGHRKQFLALVKQAKELSDKPTDREKDLLGEGPVMEEKTLRRIAEAWGTLQPEERVRIRDRVLNDLPPKYEPMIREYFNALDKLHGYKK